MSEEEKTKVWVCNPIKNKGCSGRFKPHCGIQCFCTTNPEYAIDPFHPLSRNEYHQIEANIKNSYGRFTV